MLTLLLIVFWTSLAIILYTYIGYGIIIHIISRIKGPLVLPATLPDDQLPPITVLVAAYNEGPVILEKIKDTLSLDYPHDKLKIIIVTDGSDDGSEKTVAGVPGIKHFHEPKRQGKIHAVNRVMKEVETPIVIFSDANTLLNFDALKNIVRHYQDPFVGGVAGEKRIFRKEYDNAPGTGEGLYWQYESFLKRKDSHIGSVMGAAGELFSVRTALYEAPAENMVIEDFYTSMIIVSKGYRFVYEPDAYAMETASASIGNEWKRKVRISAGAFQAIGKLGHLMNPLRHGIVSFQYSSHRVLRWTLAPVSLLTVFISNGALVLYGIPFYESVFGIQVLFYFFAGLGYIYRDRKVAMKGFFVPLYFSMMNISVYAGFLRYLRNQQSVVWEKVERQ